MKRYFKNLVSRFAPSKDVGSRNFPWMSDPVAQKTGWTAQASGGTNICTHRLRESHPGCCRFVMTASAKAFVGIFLGMGITIPAFILYQMWCENHAQPTLEMLLPLFVGAVFFGAGMLMLRMMSKPRVFDRNLGLFWVGRTSPENLEPETRYKEWVYLQEIHALQILQEYVRGNKSSYYSYELNLVMDDGQRLNVVDHGSLARLREDATKLSLFLGVPVWDVTLERSS